MQLIVDQSLAAGFIPFNTRQQRASLPFKPGVLERNVYNNDDKTFFSVLAFAMPSCDNVLQPSPLCGSGCNTLSHKGLANVNTPKRMFYPLIMSHVSSLCAGIVETQQFRYVHSFFLCKYFKGIGVVALVLAPICFMEKYCFLG